MRKSQSEVVSRRAWFGGKKTETGARKRSLRVEHLETRQLLSVVSGISNIGLVDLNYQSTCDRFYLRDNDLNNGPVNQFNFGSPGWKPIVGDWDNNGTDTPGVYNPSTRTFYLRNSNSEGPSLTPFLFGNPNWIPLSGDWNADGVDTIGAYDPVNGMFYLRDSNNGGGANYSIRYGALNLIPVVGDWNGDGRDTIGVYNPTLGQFQLRDTNDAGGANYYVNFGAAGSGWKPFVGDWDGNGSDTVGILNPNGTSSIYYLRNSNTSGTHDIACTWGIAGTNWTPIAGNWTGRAFPSVSFTDAAVENQTRLYFGRDGLINRNDAISIIQNTGSDNGSVDANELADCRTIVSNSTALGMPDYVKVLSSNVVNSNAANAHYQGQDLGNLAAGDSNAKLTNLISKWFQGTDHPSVAVGVTYQTAAGSLFVNGPSVADMDQGAAGDCYWISALGSIAATNASAISNMFVDNGNNTWTVRFYYPDGDSYLTDYVTVDKILPANGSYLVYGGNGSTYVHQALRTYNDPSNELWISLAEKAYAQWNETGRAQRPWVDTNDDGIPDADLLNGQNTYAAIDFGYVGVGYTQVLGQDARPYAIGGDGSEAVLTAAIDAGKAVMIGTRADLPGGHRDGLYSAHAYAVTAYTNDTFTLVNPWGYNLDENGYGIPMTLQVSWTTLSNDCAVFATSNTAWDGDWNGEGGMVVGPSTRPSRVGDSLVSLQSGRLRLGLDREFTSAVDHVLDGDELFMDLDAGQMASKVGLFRFA